MKLLCSVLILASILAANAKPNMQIQSALDQYLVHARSLDNIVSEDVTTQCFNLYMPLLNEVAATFSSSYQGCISTANAQTANLTAQADQQQKIYQSEVSSLCSAFTSCDSDNDTTSFFNCYASAAQSDVSVIYDLASNAAGSASSLTLGIQAIQDTEYQCTNATENNYVRDTAATYDLLNNCLKYGVPTTTTVGTTSTRAPTTSTSDGPFYFDL
ncbi:protein TsetseEP [Drosophila suzukii]|uniref:Protein TsetseEP n=1 Tax=Drosophila suzukii TaxID=28584 RepID=A0AB39Z485_DROSZ